MCIFLAYVLIPTLDPCVIVRPLFFLMRICVNMGSRIWWSWSLKWVCLQSRFLYQLHFSPVPHSDRLISPHPSIRAPGRAGQATWRGCTACVRFAPRLTETLPLHPPKKETLFPQPPEVWILSQWRTPDSNCTENTKS